MCLILFAIDSHSDYDLIIAANRDEFYKRPTLSAHIWKDPAWLLAGKDLEGGGTWLGMNLEGRLSMLTNFRDLSNIRQNAPSRGALVRDFFLTDRSADRYTRDLVARGSVYNGFNLICLDGAGSYYVSNYAEGQTQIPRGIHGLSNGVLNEPWPKVAKGKEALEQVINEGVSVQGLFKILYNDRIAADDELPDTGVGLDWERTLSPMFIKSDNYGSRTSTVILRRRDGYVRFAERTYNTDSFDYSDRVFYFRIKHP